MESFSLLGVLRSGYSRLKVKVLSQKNKQEWQSYIDTTEFSLKSLYREGV